MKWSWKIGSIFGIPVKVHLTFVLLLILVFFAGIPLIGIGGIKGMIFVILVFASVVFHELSHSMVARYYGINVVDITLLPIGGVARMPHPPSDPGQEILISIAGPLASFLLAFCLWLVAEILGLNADETGMFAGRSMLTQLALINVVLAVFNLLPAFPMDGGRVLRGLLGLYMKPFTATRIAVGVGQVFAILLFFWGLLAPNLFLILIALFVYLGAETEERQMGIMMSLGGVTAGSAMITDVIALGPDNTVGQAAERFSRGFQSDFPIMEGRRLVGLVTSDVLLDTLHKKGPSEPVGDIMIKDFATALEDTPLVDILGKIETSGTKVVPILKAGELRGLITLEQIGRYNMMCSGYSCEFMEPGRVSTPSAT